MADNGDLLYEVFARTAFRSGSIEIISPARP